MISVAFSIEGFVWKVIKCSMFNFGPNFGHNNPILSLATTFQVLFEFYSRGWAEVFAISFTICLRGQDLNIKQVTILLTQLLGVCITCILCPSLSSLSSFSFNSNNTIDPFFHAEFSFSQLPDWNWPMLAPANLLWWLFDFIICVRWGRGQTPASTTHSWRHNLKVKLGKTRVRTGTTTIILIICALIFSCPTLSLFQQFMTTETAWCSTLLNTIIANSRIFENSSLD